MKIDSQLMEKLWNDYKIIKNYNGVAKKHGVSVYMVKKSVNHFENDTDINDVIKYIDTKKKDACDFINKCMLIMSDDEKLEKASINQIASAMGIVIEKFTKNLSKDDGVFLDEIIRAVQKIE